MPPGFVVGAGVLSDSLVERGVMDGVADLARSYEPGAEGARIAGEIEEIALVLPPSEQLAERITSAYESLGV